MRLLLQSVLLVLCMCAGQVRLRVLLKQKMLNERISELIQDKELKSIRVWKRQLKKILKEYEESVQIQMSSEKILNFLINDILDFA